MSDAPTIARFVARRAGERRERIEARRKRLLDVLPSLVRALLARGARRVWLFGSLAWGAVHEQSDIDVAVEGLSSNVLLAAQGELLLLSPCGVDLIRLEEAPGTLAERIREHGRLLHG